jgi:hypothetical protein
MTYADGTLREHAQTATPSPRYPSSTPRPRRTRSLRSSSESTSPGPWMRSDAGITTTCRAGKKSPRSLQFTSSYARILRETCMPYRPYTTSWPKRQRTSWRSCSDRARRCLLASWCRSALPSEEQRRSIASPFRKYRSSRVQTQLYPSLTLTRTQYSAIPSNRGNERSLTYAEFANPCNAQQPLTAHS